MIWNLRNWLGWKCWWAARYLGPRYSYLEHITAKTLSDHEDIEKKAEDWMDSTLRMWGI